MQDSSHNLFSQDTVCKMSASQSGNTIQTSKALERFLLIKSTRNQDGNDYGAGDDVLLKVTDICSTNAADPSYCATPADIKIDRRKADLLYHNEGRSLTAAKNRSLAIGAEFPEKVYWFFTKCWDDVCVPSTDLSQGRRIYWS